MITITTPGEMATLVDEYLDLKHRAAVLDERMKQIIAALRSLGPGSHTVGAHRVSVSQPRRFSAERAAELLPADQYALVVERTVSAARAKQVLAPALYELLQVETGEPRVTIR